MVVSALDTETNIKVDDCSWFEFEATLWATFSIFIFEKLLATYFYEV